MRKCCHITLAIGFLSLFGYAGAQAQWEYDGVPVSAESLEQNCQCITHDGAGGAIIVWSEFESGNTDLYAQKLDSNGVAQWTPRGVAVCTLQYRNEFARIVPDGAGGAIITWRAGRGGDTGYDIYAQRIDDSGFLCWDQSGIPICTAIDMQFGPRIASGGAGGAIIAWTDKRDSKLDIYALRVDHYGNSPPTNADRAPYGYRLSQNYPNPFNPGTTIRFDLPRAVHVKLSIYNVKGELIATVVDRHMTKGRKEVAWAATDEHGNAVASGIYFYRLVAGDFTQTRKMILLR